MVKQLSCVEALYSKIVTPWPLHLLCLRPQLFDDNKPAAAAGGCDFSESGQVAYLRLRICSQFIFLLLANFAVHHHHQHGMLTCVSCVSCVSCAGAAAKMKQHSHSADTASDPAGDATAGDPSEDDEAAWRTAFMGVPNHSVPGEIVSLSASTRQLMLQCAAANTAQHHTTTYSTAAGVPAEAFMAQVMASGQVSHTCWLRYRIPCWCPCE